jgi:8-oxo-dGTP diphosphatase
MTEKTYSCLIEAAKQQGINRYVVGAIIEKDSKVLILQRTKDDFMGGIYELPSGEVDAGESLNVALYREVLEETGLQVENIKIYLGYFDYQSKSGKVTRQFNFVVTVMEPLEIMLEDHDNYVWIEKKQQDQYFVTDSVKNVLSSFWAIFNQ